MLIVNAQNLQSKCTKFLTVKLTEYNRPQINLYPWNFGSFGITWLSPLSYISLCCRSLNEVSMNRGLSDSSLNFLTERS